MLLIDTRVAFCSVLDFYTRLMTVPAASMRADGAAHAARSEAPYQPEAVEMAAPALARVVPTLTAEDLVYFSD